MQFYYLSLILLVSIIFVDFILYIIFYSTNMHMTFVFNKVYAKTSNCLYKDTHTSTMQNLRVKSRKGDCSEVFHHRFITGIASDFI